MNDLIRKLARQAGLNRTSNDRYGACTDQDLDRFTQELLKEVVLKAREYRHDASYLAEHFGVTINENQNRQV